MKSKFILIVIILATIYAETKANGELYSFGFWKVKNLNGSVFLESNYREQENTLPENFYDKQQSTSVMGTFKLNAETYFWHPNFCLFNANLEYSPNAVNENFLVMPNRTETTNAENIGLTFQFFDNRPLSLNVSYNKGLSYSNRDFGTSVMMDLSSFGSTLLFKNNIAPVSLSFHKSTNEEKFISTSRGYTYNRTNFSGNVSKNINGTLENRISFSNDLLETDNESAKISNIELFEVKLDNKWIIDNYNNEFLLSNFTYYNQKGTMNQNKIIENLLYRKTFLENFSLNVNYFYDHVNYDSLFSGTNTLNGRLEHQLFKSLRSFATYQYYNSNQFTSDETRNQFGLGFNYSKILKGGHLQVNYETRYDINKRTSGNIQNIVKNEEFQADDIKQMLLKFPYVIESSIQVKDISSSIIYDKNIDYIIIKRGEFTEIQRIAGGRIAKNSKIYVDYISENPANYNYDLVAHNLYLKLSTFNNLLDVYTQMYSNDFSNVVYSKYAVLNRIYSKMFGVQVNFDGANVGYELDQHNSDILPYNSNYLFIRYTKNVASGLLMSVNASYHNYFYTQTEENNEFTEANVRLSYRLTDRSNINVETGYMKQSANSFNSEFINFRLEYGINISQLLISAGVDYYHRQVDMYNTDYRGVFIKAERTF